MSDFHQTNSHAVRGDLHGTPVEWPERQPMTQAERGTPHAQLGLSRQLDRVLRDQSIVVPLDADVWARIGASAFTTADPAHSNTPPCFCRACRAEITEAGA